LGSEGSPASYKTNATKAFSKGGIIKANKRWLLPKDMYIINPHMNTLWEIAVISFTGK
jgi:hypothetical protein